MYTRHLLPGMIVLAHVILVASCSAPSALSFTDPPAADPPPIGVTPIDTSASTLIVTITIDENQDATDHLTTISFKFRTHVIRENNYVLFKNGQYVTCNVKGILALNTLQQYMLEVTQYAYDLQGYNCTYFGYTEGVGLLPPAQMFDVRARSTLDPQQPRVDDQGFRIRYTPDSTDLACTIKADAKDAAQDDIAGPPSSSALGMYVGPATGSLHGAGDILLTRTCTWTLNAPFYAINLTYQSTASVEVTWGH